MIHRSPLASNEQLLATARCGDPRAFAELCKRHAVFVRQSIYSIVRKNEGAEGALQGTLMRAFTHLGTFRGTRKFKRKIFTSGM